MVLKRGNWFYASYIVTLIALAVLGYYIGVYQLNLEKAKHQPSAAALVYYDLPRLNIASTSDGISSHSLKVSISLEVRPDNLARLEGYEPHMIDRIVSRLHSTDVGEIKGPDAPHWLREDLLRQVRIAADPIPIVDLVFREFLVQ